MRRVTGGDLTEGLRGLAIVASDDTAEFALAERCHEVVEKTFCLGHRCLCRCLDVLPRVVIAAPGRFDVIELVEAETHIGV